MALGHMDEHWGTLRGQPRGGGPSDFAEQLEFHLMNNKTINVGFSLLSQTGYIVEKGADDVPGNTMVKMLFHDLVPQ